MRKNIASFRLPARGRDFEPIGVCQRSQMIFKLCDLRKQMENVGDSKVWTGKLVYKDFIDIPHEQNKIPPIKADPFPVKNPSPIKSVYPEWVSSEEALSEGETAPVRPYPVPVFREGTLSTPEDQNELYFGDHENDDPI